MSGPAAGARVAASGVVVLLTVGGCGLGRERVPVVEVTAGSPRATSLDVLVSSCHDDPRVVRLTESADLVEIEIDARRPGSTGMDCLDALLVRLEGPIGDRVVRDAVTGRELEPSVPPVPPPG